MQMRAGYERNESGEDRREIEFGTKFEFRLETFQSKIRRVHRWVYLRHLSLTLTANVTGREEGRKRKRGRELKVDPRDITRSFKRGEQDAL